MRNRCKYFERDGSATGRLLAGCNKSNSALTVTPGRQVILSGGAQAANVFWQVGSSATLGTTSDFAGTILPQASISLNTGATLNGRALARDGAVTMQSNAATP